jgi:alpha,alpha-trehalase
MACVVSLPTSHRAGVSMSGVPIADHALLSDCHSAAMVTRSGSIDWLCFPRFDSPAVFARLLDDDAGHWLITPDEVQEVARSYLGSSLVLRTVFTTAHARVQLTDGLLVGLGERDHDLGSASPHLLVRHVECLDGNATVRIEYRPRPEYGLVRPLLRQEGNGQHGNGQHGNGQDGNGLVVTHGGPDRLSLWSSHRLDVAESSAGAVVAMQAGETLDFTLGWSRAWEAPPVPGDDLAPAARLDDTVAAWDSWAEQHQRYDGPWAAEVRFAGVVLQGLTFKPSAAIVAAATTSLPEARGGERNWDYRYTWIRDASMTLDALWVAACPDEAQDFLAWLVGTASSAMHEGGPLQIMYGVGGEHDLTERELPHLDGWSGARPVRVGNGAWTQTQLDVYGELLAAVHRLRDELGELDAPTRRFLIEVAEAAAARWIEPDHGIWEMRGEPRRFLYSALMCWVALDRAVQLAEPLHATDRVRSWAGTRDQIAQTICTRGYNERLGAFTQTLDGDELDASTLMIPIVGLLPGTDPRVISTIEVLQRELSDEHGLLRRYRSDDGLGGKEGAFVFCTFWLAHALALSGEVDRARETFQRALKCANDVGLLSEEFDSAAGEQLGNLPQAFSHIGLVNAAWAISQAEQGELST